MAASWKQYYGAKGSILASGGIDGWHLVSTSPAGQMANSSIQKDKDGHFISASKHTGGARQTITETWKPDGNDATSLEVTLGDVANDVAVESASLACTGSDRPTLTLTGHIHLTSENNSCKHIGDTYKHTFHMPSAAYGVADPFNGAIPGAAEFEMTSSTQTATIDHVDEYGRSGEFLVGCSRGVRVTGHYEATTDNEATLGDVAQTAWTVTNVNAPTSNEGMKKLTVDAVKYVSTASSSASPSSGT